MLSVWPETSIIVLLYSFSTSATESRTPKKLGQHGDAEAQLAKLRADNGFAYQWAEIYAQWSNAAKGLDALDVAFRLRNPGLRYLKVDPLLNPLRREPRFQEIERELKFPN